MPLHRYTHAVLCRIPLSLRTRGEVVLDEARKQHLAVAELLRELGIDVVEMPPDENSPLCPFVEDVAVVCNGTALIARPQEPSRLKEIETIRAVLKKELDIPLVEIADKNARLDGGDVLFTGREFFVGLSQFTNEAGARAVAAAFPEYPCVPIKVAESKRLKSLVTMAGPDVICVGAGKESQEVLKRIAREATYCYQTLTVPEDDAANVVYVNGTLIHRSEEEIPNSSKVFADKVEFPTRSLRLSELAKKVLDNKAERLVMASPAPKSPEQSEKNRKYDRQLRLWGDHGQASLEAAHICVINATGLGTEILKSLVLPGIGAFTIVDGKKITHEDIGANFFLDVDSVGKSRAQVATQMLLELNPDVRGDYIDEGPEQILHNSPEFFDSFTVVVATALAEKPLIMLSKKLWDLNIPLIVCRSIGFIAYMRVQVREHTIIETHPDNELPDLRLDRPFESLKNYLEPIDLDSMDLKDHSHTPYVVVLYKYLQKWTAQYGGLPKTYRDKQKLREIVRDGIRRDEQGLPIGEENFEEAMRAVNTSIGTSRVPQSVMDILNDERCVNLTAKSSKFWIIAKGVRDFMENEGGGLLPVKGSLPDMTADSEKYIALQQIYHKQAVADVEAVWRHTLQLLRQLGRPSDSISEKDVKLFCRHSSDIHVERGTSIADEYDPKTINANDIAQSLENPDSMLVYYVLLRGVEKFQAEYNSYPGEFDDHVEPDIVKLKACVSKLLGEWGCGSLSKDDYVHEFCRFGGCELHSVSAFLGGLAAQETIKFITCQYKPIHNTFIHDAVTSNSTTFFF